MPVKFEFENPYMGAWMLLRQVYNLISKCNDLVFSNYKLTTEQHSVLMAIKHIEDPVKVTDVARWLDRSVNSVSMIIDRMVKVGLVRRRRDLPDRRAVRLTITSKAEEAYVPATISGWELIQEILAPLPDKDILTLTRLLEVLRDKTYDYLGSGEVVEKVKRDEDENMAWFMKQAAKYSSLSTPEAKPQCGEKEKTI